MVKISFNVKTKSIIKGDEKLKDQILSNINLSFCNISLNFKQIGIINYKIVINLKIIRNYLL